MAKLTTADRNAMPWGQFALPGGRYPIPDASHAANAKARASQQYNAGNLSAAQKAVVDRKADAKLGHPRTHALTMASADHLHREGYIGSAQHQSIRGQAQAKMDAHKAGRTFGSLG
jgi:hypothetical protein